MSGFTEGGGRRRRRRRFRGGTAAVFCLWVVLSLTELSSLATAAHGKASWSPPRRALFLNLESLPVVSSPTNSGVATGDAAILYGEDKRKIPTGPNPLHN